MIQGDHAEEGGEIIAGESSEGFEMTEQDGSAAGSSLAAKTGIEAEEYVPGALNPRAIYFLCQWIAISGGMIMFNKWLMTKNGFPHPMALTSWHMVFGSVMTQVCVVNGFGFWYRRTRC